KRVFLVILFTSFSGSLVSRISGAVHLFRFAGCGSPLLILLVAGPWPATVEENPGKGRNNDI
ncbi:hypothetical protein, partial [Escherichia coli]|uniref:hypothetical protein n=1 Tax=Escherichia coli TaxID=562 RepID=UPI001BDD5D3F